MMVNAFKYYVALALASCLLNLFASEAHAIERFVEFNSSIETRSQQSFKTSPQEKGSPLEAGTRAEILNFEKLSGGEFALQVRVLTGPKKGETVWIADRLTRTKLTWQEQPFATASPVTVVNANVPAKPLPPPAKVAAEKESVDIRPQMEAIDRINKTLTQVGDVRPIAPQDCATCTTPDLPSNRQKCEGVSSGYLENEMKWMYDNGDTLVRSMFGNRVNIPKATNPRCMEQAMMTFNHNARYPSCNPGDVTPKAFTGIKPCISDRYFNLTYNSFELAGYCMRALLPGAETDAGYKNIMNSILAQNAHESGFMMNAMSSTGASGIGQLTYGAVQDINRNQLAMVTESLKEHQDPLCRDLAKKYLSTPMTPGNTCGYVSLSGGNPMKNIIYGMAYYRTTRQFLDSQVFNQPTYRSRLTTLSPSELEKFKLDASTWAYNAGPAGIAHPLKSMILSTDMDRASYIDLRVRTRVAMRSTPHPANSSTRRVDETSNYLAKIETRFNNIKAAVPGGKCIQ